MKNKERIAILESEISRLKVANRNNTYRIEAIESHLAEQHKGANFSKLNSSEIPNTCEAVKPDFIPDWKDAPEDAVCVAMDKDGKWHWYDRKPSVIVQCQAFAHGGIISDAGNCTNAHLLPPDYWKSTLMMRPEAISDAPDYTHLLPEGYEFCSEADAEKWVKVEYEAGWPLGIVVDITDKFKMDAIMYNHIKPSYRPIRPIQYKVTTHEIVTAVPDPYMPDWSQAPEGTVAHAWDEDGRGFWYHASVNGNVWLYCHRKSDLTPPADLDWKQSLRVKPN
jgi:hypothetical protein